MIEVFVLFFIFIVENQFFLSLLNGWFENFVRPLVFLSPVILFRFILEVVVADVRVAIRNTDVHTSVFEHSGNFSQHLLGILFRIRSALYKYLFTRIESSMPLSITQSKV